MQLDENSVVLSVFIHPLGARAELHWRDGKTEYTARREGYQYLLQALDCPADSFLSTWTEEEADNTQPLKGFTGVLALAYHFASDSVTYARYIDPKTGGKDCTKAFTVPALATQFKRKIATALAAKDAEQLNKLATALTLSA